MTKDELLTELKKIDTEAEEKTNDMYERMYERYAFSNNPYKIGDTITDCGCTIKITKINYARILFTKESQCLYTGIQLKKDGSPCKRQTDTQIYQSNIIKPGGD